MKQTVSEYDFIEAFKAYDRCSTWNSDGSMSAGNFTIPALRALFDHLESLEDDIGEEYELDVIALCCEYAEYTLPEILSEYEHMFDKDDLIEIIDDDDDILLDYIVETLQDHTIVIPFEFYDLDRNTEQRLIIESF